MGIKKIKYIIPSNLTGVERKQKIFNKTIELDIPTKINDINIIVNYIKRPLGSILLTAYIYTEKGVRNSLVLPYYIDTKPNVKCDVFNTDLFSSENSNGIILNFDNDIIVSEINFDLNSIYDSEFEVTIINKQ